MINKYGYGTFSKLVFLFPETESGKQHAKTLYDFFNGRTDFEIAEELYGMDAHEDSYEEDLLMYAGLDCFCYEKCKVEWVNEFSFNLDWYTYYGAPMYILELLVCKYKDFEIEGSVERNYFDDDEGKIFVETGLGYHDGKWCYEKYENDHELEFAEDCLQWTT